MLMYKEDTAGRGPRGGEERISVEMKGAGFNEPPRGRK